MFKKIVYAASTLLADVVDLFIGTVTLNHWWGRFEMNIVSAKALSDIRKDSLLVTLKELSPKVSDWVRYGHKRYWLCFVTVPLHAVDTLMYLVTLTRYFPGLEMRYYSWTMKCDAARAKRKRLKKMEVNHGS